MTGVVISSAARTAVGSYGKSLAGVPPTDLGATAVTSALERAQTAPDLVGLDLGALDRGGHRGRAKLGGRHAGEALAV